MPTASKPKIPVNEVKVTPVPQTAPAIPPNEIKVFDKVSPGPGRPLFGGKSVELVLQKLEECAAIDATVKESCYYAGISQTAYYSYLTAHPEFREHLETLREKPVLAARQAAVSKAGESYANAIDYLKRKRRDEFGDRVASENLNLNLNKDVDELDPQDAIALANIIKKQYHAGSIKNNAADDKQSPRLPAKPVHPEAQNQN